MRTFSLPAMFSYVALAGTAFAAPSVWDGGSTSGGTFWQDAVNWAGNALPPVSADVEFGTGFASGKNVIVDENHVLRSLTFRNAPSNLHLTYDFGGPGTLYLTEGILTRLATSSGEQLIALPIYLLEPGKLNIDGAGGRLRIDGNITSSAFDGLTAGLIKDGSAELLLYGQNSWDGTTMVRNGRLTLASNGALPSSTVLLLESTLSQHPQVVLNEGVTATMTLLRLLDGTKVTGGTTSAVASGVVYLDGQSELGVKLVGNAQVELFTDADAKISKAGTYTGTVTIDDGATLSVMDEGGLGAATNTVVFDGEGHLVLTVGDELGSQRHLVADSVTAHIEGATQIHSKFEGDGTFSLVGDGSHAIFLSNTRPNFDGEVILDGDSGSELVLDTGGCLGHANAIFLDGEFDILRLAADNPALDAPALTMANHSRLKMRNHNATFGTFHVDANIVTIELQNDTTNRDLHLHSIALSAAGELHIAGWVGTPGTSGHDDKIFVDLVPVSSVLKKITFDNLALTDGAKVLPGGELVPKPAAAP